MKTEVRCSNLFRRTLVKASGFLLAMFMLFTGNVEATHIAGGELTYEHQSGNIYRVTGRIYRDCDGINLPTSITIRSTCSPTSFTLPRTGVRDITPVCPGGQSPCQSSFAPGIGYEEWTYSANVTINPTIGGSCTLSWNSCCRNFAITNLSNGGNNSFEIRTILNNNRSPRNSSPTFLNPPIAVVCVGQQATISPNASDPDGDALQYSLTTCLQTGGSSVTYGPGFSATNPISTTSGINLNTFTGLLTFTPNNVQVGVICTKVEEFNAGTKIGEINRDIQVNVINCNNNNPIVAPINNQIAQVGNQLCVPVSATDADNDNITLTVTSSVGSFTVNSSSAGSANGTFCFTPTLSQQGQTFTVTVNAVDDACPSPGSGAGTFNITVPAVQCSLSINATAVGASCNQADGSATVTQTGGVNPISYSWSNGASTQSISNLAPGSYTVTVVDGYNCVETATVTVNGGSTNIAATLSTSNPSCPASTNGSITVSTTGGTAPITYSLNGGASQSSNVFSGLGVGSYTVEVTDASGCPGITLTASLNAVDNVPPVINCPNDVTVSCTASTAPSATGSATATDNCTTPSVTFADQVSAGTCPANNTINRTWTATDAAGNTSTCVQVITIVDNTAPVVSCPANISVNTDAGQCSAVVTYNATATDDCSGANLSYSTASGTAFATGSTTVNVTATDGCGNTSNCSFTVSVSDNENPVISCPADLTIDCAASTQPSNTGSATATDNCTSTPSVSFTDVVTTSTVCPANKSIARTWTATDAAGNSSSCVQNITIVDNTAPVVSCPANISVNNDAGVCGAAVTYAATATDDCSTTSLGYSVASGSVFAVGTTSVVATATDACGNASSCQFSVTVADNEAPVISCPATAIVDCRGSTRPSATGTATATDNCTASPVVTFSDMTSIASACPANRTITRTWTATDAAGNSSSCTQTINVVDNTAPILVCPANITVSNAAGQCGNTATFRATGTDDCSVVTLSYSNTSGSFFPVGSTTVGVVATDACGNASNCDFTVTVLDEEDPTIVCPANITVSNDPGQCGAVVTYNAPQTADNCQSAPISNLSAGDLAFTGYGADNPDFFSWVFLKDIAAGTVINFTDNGWFSSGGFRSGEGVLTWTTTTDLPAGTEVTILNNTASVGSAVNFINGGPNLSTGGDQVIAFQGTLASPTSIISAIQMNGAWDANATSSNTSAIPSGLVDGVNAISIAPEVDNGTYNCSTTSGSGVAAAVNNASNWNVSNTAVTPVACGFAIPSNAALPQLTSGLGSGMNFPVGTTVETYTVSDGAGNTATCSFTVTVEDNEAPQINCPADITVNNDAGVCGAAVTYTVTASDNCAMTSMPTSTLGLGDIAFTGYNSDNPDAWSFVILKDISAGTQINFTDNGWFAAGGFRASEGIATWEATAGMTAGSEVIIEGLVPTAGTISSTVNGGPNLSASGDQLFAYQGSATSPSFITAIQMNGAWDADATSSNTSAQPSVLTDGVNSLSIAPENDNAKYDCSTTNGGASAIRAAVNNSNNWIVSSNRIAMGICGFVLPNGSLTPSITAGLASGATFPVGTTVVSYEVTDAAGNTSTCSFNVTVNDNEAPSITCPADVTIECIRDVPVADINAVTASDNCAIDFITHDGDTDNGGTGCNGDPKVISRSYTATDIYGNTSSCVQTITVESTPIVTQTSPNAIVFPAYQDSSCATISVAAMGGCPGYTYLWSNGSTNSSQQVCPTVTTVYTVTVTDAEGCSTLDSVKVCAIDVSCTSRTNNGVGGSGQAGNSGQLRITICHIPPGNPSNAMTKCLPPSGARNHILAGHGGDHLGACGTLASRSCDLGTPSPSRKTDEGSGAEPMTEATMEAFPNPFSHATKVVIRLNEATTATVVVFDMTGQQVASLYDGSIDAGQELSLDFNANGLSNGMYFVRLVTAEGLVLNKKVNLQK